MKRVFVFSAILLTVVPFAFAQSKSNTEINKQIRQLNEKNISVSYDGSTSKLMAVADNFADKESAKAGIQAMNFAVGFFYPGDQLKDSPDPIMFTFWVLSKKPRFADIQNVIFNVDGQPLLVDNIRYSARARDNVEYINCKLSRADISKIASGRDVRVRLGEGEFKFLPAQIRMMADVLVISKTGAEY